MCGFVGLIGENIPQENFSIIIQAASQISHRGPDESVVYSDDHTIICFHRLAIVGSSKAAQPFVDRNKNLVVVVNGEIYNYKLCKELLGNSVRYVTDSDCEVVLHLYHHFGLAYMLANIRGIFSIILYDRTQQSVFLIRDKSGVKPLYYTIHKGVIYFASEIKALMAIPALNIIFDVSAALSEPWLAGFPAYNTTEPYSLFKNVCYLPGGNVLQYRVLAKEVSMHKYWDPIAYVADTTLGIKAHRRSYKEALKYSVAEESCSGKTAGLLLSGGIDSAVVAYLAAQHTNVICFSIDSKTFYLNKDQFWAKKIAQKMAIPCHFIPISETIADIIEWIHLVYLCETPYIGPEQIYKYPIYQYIKAEFPSIKVVFSGQGSDEFNGGYTTQFGGIGSDGWSHCAMVLDHIKYNTHNWGSSLVAKWWNKIDNHIDIEIIRSAQIYPMVDNVCLDHQNTWSCYIQNKARDLQMYNLWQEDRLSASNGLENRVPFLNDYVLNAVLRVPQKLHHALFWDKSILRRAFQKELSKSVAYRPKVPLFYGEGLNHTIQMMFRLITMDHFALIDFAFPYANNWLNKKQFLCFIQKVMQTPPYKGWEKIIRLINMGILEQMHLLINKNQKPFHYLSVRPNQQKMI